MAVPVHVPYDEGLVGKAAGADEDTWVGRAKSPLEIGGVDDPLAHGPLDFRCEFRVIRRIQE